MTKVLNNGNEKSGGGGRVDYNNILTFYLAVLDKKSTSLFIFKRICVIIQSEKLDACV